jgi:hypothetical protein
MSRHVPRLGNEKKAGNQQSNTEKPPRISLDRSDEQSKAYSNNPKTCTRNYKHDLFDWVSLIVLVFTFIAAGWAAIEAGRLADTADHTERTQLRAFVYFDKPVFQIFNIAEPEGFGVWNLAGSLGKGASVSLTLVNGGDTPATPLKVVISCPAVLATERPPDDPFSLFKWDDKKAVSYVIGPKQTITIGQCAELKEVEAGDTGTRLRRQYILGDAIYHDVIDPSIRHETQFAHEMIILDPSFNNFSAISRPVGQHNCADEACPNYVK